MTIHSNFRPRYGSTQSITSGPTSATITIGKASKTLRIRNTGTTNTIWVRPGLASDGTVTATTADMPVAPGEVVYIEKAQDFDTLAYIQGAGSTTATVTAGEGGMGSGS